MIKPLDGVGYVERYRLGGLVVLAVGKDEGVGVVQVLALPEHG